MDCYRHPGVDASNKCFTCMRPICDDCTSTRAVELMCRACADKRAAEERRAASVKMVVVTLLGALLVAAVVIVVKRYEPPYDYGRFAPDVSRLNTQLEREPCDRQKTLGLLDTMVQAGDYRGTLTRADAFFAKCGDMPRLRWLTYAAHKHLSEFDLAAVEAGKLIDSDSGDRDFWWWRGDAYFLGGKYEQALADFKQVQELCPRCTVGWQIADTADKLGRPCDGLAPLRQTLATHPDASDVSALEERVSRLASTCDPSAPPADPAVPHAEAGAQRGRPGATPLRDR